MEDGKIIELYWSRSSDAIPASEEKYGPWCRNLSLGIVGNWQDAEECVNDTWLRAWHAMPPHRPQRLGLFLGKITRNLSLDKLKGRKREKRGGGVGEVALEELEEVLSGGINPQDALEDRAVVEALNRWLGQLPREKQTAFLLRYWQMAGIAEIAGRLRCSEGKVTSMLHRLRQNLRTYLEKEGIPV